MKYHHIFILIVIIIALYSCDRCHEPGKEVHGNFNAFFNIHKNNQILYTLQTSICDSIGEYCVDSVKLFDFNFNLLPLSYSSDSSSCIFSYLPIYNESSDYLAKSQVILKIFYLKLNYLDTDTIEIKYSLAYNRKCKYYYFQNETVFYNKKEIEVNGHFDVIGFIK
ncbi:MAG: hypothetical protein A2X08_08210 [Bacteroidetes bacterium GWA2_32_17]|nr:MAG: hypothetical protein A2X08_08210 [Bacteroidetes bacterium GWA2_32_17]